MTLCSVGYVLREPVQSTVLSVSGQEIYKELKKFSVGKFYGYNLKKKFQKCISEVKNDKSLNLQSDEKKELARWVDNVGNFKPLLDELSQIHSISFDKREQKTYEILYNHFCEDYCISEDVFHKIFKKFIKTALEISDKKVKTTTDYIIELESSLKRIEKEIEEGSEQQRQLLEELKRSVLIWQNICYNPELEVLGKNIDARLKNLENVALETNITVKEINQNVKFIRKNLKVDSGDILETLRNYGTQKMAHLNETRWPYDIDEKSFINLIDLENGYLLDISNNDLPRENNLSRHCNCLSHIKQQIINGPVICVGNYGMGKSTISKMLFKECSIKGDIYPVFLNLSYVKLENYCGDGLENQVIEEINIALKSQNINLNGSLNRDNINNLINSHKILLILDGIDESVCDKSTIINLIKNLSEKNILCFLTCRLEFTPFFNAVNSLQITNGNIYKKLNGMKLSEWHETQWREYGKGLLEKYPDKVDLINKFIHDVIDEIYDKLPNRPLFFKMLSDLIINNETEYQIALNLESNQSEIYYKFICWKICDDLNRKSSSIDLDFGIYQKEAFNLLKSLSLIQYKKDFGDSNEDALKINLTTIKEKCQKFNVIESNQIINIMLNSSLFSIIRRKSYGDEFIFSHKSIMEYLVAYNIAEGLLTKKEMSEKSVCNEHWYLFQTQEVSDHLMKEVERIRITYGLTENERDNMLLCAFKSALDEVKDHYKHDDRIEEILYYLGKFELLKRSEIESRQIIDYLMKIIENRELCPEKYYRTISITLSRVVDRKYCENYVLELLNDFNGEGKRFGLNKEIQIQYYGEANLRRNLKKDLDQYIAGDSQSDIISLKILTYFTAIPQNQSERNFDIYYLQKISESAGNMQHTNIQKICNQISKIV